jgi:uncharacterized phiE125 gp8 family phage protein
MNEPLPIQNTAYASGGAPAVEPLSLTDAKLHLRVDISDDDDLITALIKAARRQVEALTGRTLITSTFEWRIPRFENVFYVPRPPLQSVSSIVYTDDDSTDQTLSTSIYGVHTQMFEGCIYLENEQEWPTDLSDIPFPITVTYVAGYGDAASNVPEDFIHAMRLMIGDWYEHREANLEVSTSVNPAVDALLWAHRCVENY